MIGERVEDWKMLINGLRSAQRSIEGCFSRPVDTMILRQLLLSLKTGVEVSLQLNTRSLLASEITEVYLTKFIKSGGRLYWRPGSLMNRTGSTNFFLADECNLLIIQPDEIILEHCGPKDKMLHAFRDAIASNQAESLALIDQVSRPWLEQLRNEPEPAGKYILPVVLFQADRLALKAGERILLRWEVKPGVSQVRIIPGPNGELPANGSHYVQPERTTTYRLFADLAGGQKVARSLTLSVLSEIGLTYRLSMCDEDGGEFILEEDPELPGYFGVVAGYDVYLDWESTSATSCTLSNYGPIASQGRIQLNLPVERNELQLVASNENSSVSLTLVIKQFSIPEAPLPVIKPPSVTLKYKG